MILLLACAEPETSRDPVPRDAPPARWQFLVYMDGDNDLEEYVVVDLNELERTGSGHGVEVLVQADRIEGYDDKDGDWTGARRYRIVADNDPDVVSSPVLQDLGEVDMASPETLADFIDWAAREYPAEHRALVLWDHGDGWLVTGTAGAPPPGIASDDTSGTVLSIAGGDLAAALEPGLAAHGRFDVLAFDACNMASWEVAHAMQPYARYMSAAETWVGWEGFMYQDVLAFIRDDHSAEGAELAVEMSRGAVEDGGELTHSATDLDALLEVSARVDELAGLGLETSEYSDALLAGRDGAQGMDDWWEEWYLDLGDLAAQLVEGGEPGLAAAAAELTVALDEAVIGNFAAEEYAWAGGLTILFDPIPAYMELYSEGDGATWSRDTRWDDYLKGLK
ncbi:MAG: hypothetical protein FJ090_12130 [Deltaproteobacteria bacterium]|nr:hypothetical protein [Deltaproteobacteria bacterium]